MFRWPVEVLGMLGVVVLLLIAARIVYSGFLDSDNLRNIGRQNVALGLVAIGVAVVMIGGNFDLSVAGTYGLAAVMSASIAQDSSVVLAVAAALAAGAVAGAINALVVTGFRVNSFMATFATGAILVGVALKYADNGQVTVETPAFEWLGTAYVAGLPLDLVILAVAFVVVGVLLWRTPFGRHVTAVGGSYEGARLAGIMAARVRAWTYVLSGVLAALAGVISASKIGVGDATTGGNLVLDSIAVVVVGGIAVSGGRGAIWRVAVGLAILAILQNIFDALEWSAPVQQLAQGIVIVLALAIQGAIAGDFSAWRSTAARWFGPRPQGAAVPADMNSK